MKKEIKLAYLKELNDNVSELMTSEKQIECIKKYRETGDLKYANKLIKSNLRYIYTLAKKYERSNLDIDELISVGCFGMLEAMRRYDLSRGVTFLTFARKIIEREMQKNIAEFWSVVKIPLKLWYLMKKVQKQYGENGDIEKIAEENDISVELALRLLNQKPAYSLEATVNGDLGTTIGDLIGQDDNEYVDDIYKYVLDSLAILDDQEKMIIKMRFGIDNKKSYTLEEISKTINKTGERVRQIQNKALSKLRIVLGEDNRI